MRLVKRILTRKKQVLIAQCNACGREIEVPYDNALNPHMPTIDLKTPVECECGDYHNLITDEGRHRPITAPPATAERQAGPEVKCPRCSSSQLHAGHKGFSLGKAAAGGLLVGPVGLLGGLIGSKQVMITCVNCGHKWRAGSQ